MREQSKDKDRLQHILECIDNVFQFLDGKTFEDMTNNRMCFHAVVYNIMIIGEAANMLTKEFRDENQDTPWRDIIDMRNVLVHGYYIASPKFVWDTYVNDLPILKQQVENYLNALWCAIVNIPFNVTAA